MSREKKGVTGTLTIFVSAAILVLIAAACHGSAGGLHTARVEVHRVKVRRPCASFGHDPCAPPLAAPPPPPCGYAGPCAPRRLLHASGSGPRFLSCPEGGCVADISGSGAVVVQCGAGGCDVNASGSGSRVLMCNGGGCSMRCAGSGTCVTVGCNGNCRVSCSGSGTCGQPDIGGFIASAYQFLRGLDID